MLRKEGPLSLPPWGLRREPKPGLLSHTDFGTNAEGGLEPSASPGPMKPFSSRTDEPAVLVHGLCVRGDK